MKIKNIVCGFLFLCSLMVTGEVAAMNGDYMRTSGSQYFDNQQELPKDFLTCVKNYFANVFGRSKNVDAFYAEENNLHDWEKFLAGLEKSFLAYKKLWRLSCLTFKAFVSVELMAWFSTGCPTGLCPTNF